MERQVCKSHRHFSEQPKAINIRSRLPAKLEDAETLAVKLTSPPSLLWSNAAPRSGVEDRRARTRVYPPRQVIIGCLYRFEGLPLPLGMLLAGTRSSTANSTARRYLTVSNPAHHRDEATHRSMTSPRAGAANRESAKVGDCALGDCPATVTDLRAAACHVGATLGSL